MKKDLVDLNDQERLFVEILFHNGGDLRQAGEEAGYHPGYVYKLRARLSKAILQASEEFLAMGSMKAAKRLVDAIDAEITPPVQVQAAQAVLDRVGIVKHDPNANPAPVIKANIFILPEKREIIDVECQ